MHVCTSACTQTDRQPKTVMPSLSVWPVGLVKSSRFGLPDSILLGGRRRGLKYRISTKCGRSELTTILLDVGNTIPFNARTWNKNVEDIMTRKKMSSLICSCLHAIHFVHSKALPEIHTSGSGRTVFSNANTDRPRRKWFVPKSSFFRFLKSLQH